MNQGQLRSPIHVPQQPQMNQPHQQAAPQQQQGPPPQQQGGGLNPAMQQQLASLEQAAQAMYSSSPDDGAERNRALVFFQSFRENVESIPMCQLLLDHSRNNYALLVAAMSLQDLIRLFWNNFAPAQTVDIRNYLLTYLYNKLGVTDSVVLGHLVRLVAQITKMGWRKSEAHQNVCNEIARFLDGASIQHAILGLDLLAALVQAMDERIKGESLSDYRRTNVSFRDKALHHIFQLAMSKLQLLLTSTSPLGSPEEVDQLTKKALELSLACLNYDFLNGNSPQNVDERRTVHLPSTWRTMIHEGQALKLYFSLLPRLADRRVHDCMEVLIGLASIRKSFFVKDDMRLRYITHLCIGTHEILSNKRLLQDTKAYHALCRMLVRIKANCQLKELFQVEGIREWLDTVARFTIDSFGQWEQRSNGIYFLVDLWARFASALSFVRSVKDPAPRQFIEQFVPQMAVAFLNARLDSIAPLLQRNEVETAFAEPDMSDHLRALPGLCRCSYVHMVSYFGSRFQPLLTKMDEMTGQLNSMAGPVPPDAVFQMRVVEAQLAMLIYSTGCVIGQCSTSHTGSSKSGGPSKEELRLRELQCDAQLTTFTIHALHRVAARQAHNDRIPPFQPLYESLVSFMQFFRANHVGTSVETSKSSALVRAAAQQRLLKGPASSSASAAASASASARGRRGHSEPRGSSSGGKDAKSKLRKMLSSLMSSVDMDDPDLKPEQVSVYTFLEQSLGPQGSEPGILSLMLNTIVETMKVFPREETVLRDCLFLLENLTQGYKSGKLMAKLDTAHLLLRQHGPEYFPFLNIKGNEDLRVSMATTLGRFLFDGNPDLFFSFVEPYDRVLTTLANLPNPRVPQAQAQLIGICLDLTGLCAGARSATKYSIFFDWLYPRHLGVLVRMLETWWDSHEVTTPLLGFIVELCTNRHKRLAFPPSSANGVLLFREVSKVMGIYGNRILELAQNTEADDVYEERVRGAALCIDILAKCLAGDFVCFGVFKVYKDPSLDSALNVVMKLVMSIPFDTLMAYPDVATTFFNFTEVLFKSHLGLLIERDPTVFISLFSTLIDGLQLITTDVTSRCCRAIDSVFTYRVEGTRKRSAAADMARMDRVLSNNAEVVMRCFRILFNMALFETGSQWAVSRPLLPMILANNQLLADYLSQLMSTQKPQVAQQISTEFAKISENVDTSLDSESRNVFTRNMYRLRTSLDKVLLRPGNLYG